MLSQSLPPIERQLTSSGKLSLFQAKQARKQVEQEITSIQNRITLLQNEQSRTTKQSRQTEMRALNIYEAKIRTEKQKKQREEHRKLFQVQSTTYQKHQEELEKIKISKVQTLKEKQLSVRNLKSRLSEDYKTKIAEDHQSIREKQVKALQIKQMESQLLDSIKHKRDNSHQMVRQEIERQVEEELKKKYYQERLIAHLDQKEKELVLQLQESQLNQKNSISWYKDAKNMSATDFQRAYLSSLQSPSGRSSQSFYKKQKQSLNKLPSESQLLTKTLQDERKIQKSNFESSTPQQQDTKRDNFIDTEIKDQNDQVSSLHEMKKDHRSFESDKKSQNLSHEQHISKDLSHHKSKDLSNHKSKDVSHEQHKSKDEQHKSKDEQNKSKDEQHKQKDEQHKSKDVSHEQNKIVNFSSHQINASQDHHQSVSNSEQLKQVDAETKQKDVSVSQNHDGSLLESQEKHLVEQIEEQEVQEEQ